MEAKLEFVMETAEVLQFLGLGFNLIDLLCLKEILISENIVKEGISILCKVLLVGAYTVPQNNIRTFIPSYRIRMYVWSQ